MSTISNDFPQVVDKSTLTGIFNAGQYLSVGVEGEAASSCSCTVGLPVVITSAEDSDTQFGTSTLGTLVKALLSRGLDTVIAVASKKGSAPDLLERQTAWAALEDDPNVRIRLTDSTTQADLVALADSCEDAETIQHKQFALVSLAAGSSKSTIEGAGDAIASKRCVLVGPALLAGGNTLDGDISAAWAAAEIAKNPDITDSMNLASIAGTSGIEVEAATGLPLFRLRANGGAPIDDFQDLLDHGVSPFMTGPDGAAAFTHIRTTYTVDDTYDALMTLLIEDQIFIDIRNLLLNSKTLRTGNTPTNRSLAAKMVDSYLQTHDNMVQPVLLASGKMGFGVTVVASNDLKSYTVNYFGQIVRGTNVININGTFTIPVST